MPEELKFRTDAERLGDLLFKSTSGPDPEECYLTYDEDVELEELWNSMGYDLMEGPYIRSYNDDGTKISTNKPLAPGTAVKYRETSDDCIIPRQHPRILNWDEDERGAAGQRGLPSLMPVPILAERIFLALAREWIAEYDTHENPRRLTTHMGDLALACLSLAVKWGREFSGVAREQMETNRAKAASFHHPSWMNELPWKLCQSSDLIAQPFDRMAVQELTVNLDHHNSRIRRWMMEIAWFAVPWLDAKAATEKLMPNIADTLLGVWEAAGLACKFFDNDEKFLKFMAEFPTGRFRFKKQWFSRIKFIKEYGIRELQAPFMETENICNREIQRVGLGLRLVVPSPADMLRSDYSATEFSLSATNKPLPGFHAS